MNYTDRSIELKAEINRVSAIIQTTNSPYLRRDLEKYLKRLEKQARYGVAPKSSKPV